MIINNEITTISLYIFAVNIQSTFSVVAFSSLFNGGRRGLKSHVNFYFNILIISGYNDVMQINTCHCDD